MSEAPRCGAVAKPGPAVILVRPQLGENIGMVARAMANFGLDDLRLVAPRDGWPNEAAQAAASGADAVIRSAALFPTTAEAVSDLRLLYAASARERDMVKPVSGPRAAAAALRKAAADGCAAGVLFGPERAGLENDDVALADNILVIPTAPSFRSLNLAQAALVLGYEWFLAGAAQAESASRDELALKATRPATKEELMGLFAHLEGALDESGFLHPPEKRPGMVRNIRNMLGRANLTEQDVRTLRGIVAALARGRGW